jgi:hypothetical protein
MGIGLVIAAALPAVTAVLVVILLPSPRMAAALEPAG